MLTKIFGFNPKETKLRTEIMAGLTTFLTMAYILAVNPNILGETGMDKGALFTTTALMAGLATIFMGVYAKLPLALAPGMGLNAFFAYTVCLVMGHSWQFALTAVFLEGILFILLTVTNLREKRPALGIYHRLLPLSRRPLTMSRHIFSNLNLFNNSLPLILPFFA